MSTQKALAQEDVREESRQTFQLTSNARVEVLNVNSAVIIQTSDSDVVEVEIVRQATRQKDLKYHRVNVEHAPDSLIVQGKEDRAAHKRRIKVRQQVRLKIPRQASLLLRGIGGPVQIGELEGPVRVEQVSGPVEIGPVAGALAVAGAAGDLRATVRHMDQGGIQISNIGGRVEMRFAEALDAELTAKSIGGGININLPNVETYDQDPAVSMSTRIGTGGSPISILKVSGAVQLALGL
ncbi:MAG TPA: hypothetical protein VJP89_05080 [Pyrinomonadaceae bacterium]|nr:hypothetical protein [Pyrinomonadaceae bacterium]